MAGRLVRSADKANRDRDWGRAERLYGAALTLAPGRADLRVQLGHALKEQGFLHRAAREYRGAAADDHRSVDPFVQLVAVEKLIGRRDEAVRACLAGLQFHPESAELRGDLRALGAPEHFVGSKGDDLILEQHDLTPAVLSIFDDAYYAQAHREALPETARGERAALLRHFGTVGVEALHPVSAQAGFDAAFYRSTYLGGRRLPPSRAYRHWLNIGLSRNWAPNRTVWRDGILGSGRMQPGRQEPEAATPITDVEAAFASSALLEQILGDRPIDWPHELTDGEAVLLPSLAGNLSRAGLHAKALAVRRLILRHRPDHAAVRRDAAADLLASGDPAGARAMVEGLDRRFWTAATFATLAACLDIAGQAGEAVAMLGAGIRAFPADQGLRRRFAQCCDRAIHGAWRMAEREALDGDAAAGRRRLEEILGTVVRAFPPGEPARPAGPIASVAIVGNADLPQCRLYRLDGKLEQLAENFRATFYDEVTEVPRFLADMVQHQAVIFYRVPAHHHVIDAIVAARTAGLVTFYEIDDLLFDAASFPPGFDSFGGQISAHDYAGLQLAPPMYAQAMRLCDHGLASTPTLAAHMRPFVQGQVFVHRNALGRAHALYAGLPVEPRGGDHVTLFYGSGTKAHKGDFQDLVEEALVDLAARYRDRLSIVLVGAITLSPRLASIRDRLVLIDMLPVDRFWTVLSSADINLAVLSPSPANDSKSEIKWLEAAMVGVPSVVSGTATYREVVEEGVTGLLCDTPAQWSASLRRLVDDAGFRRRLGAQARRHVLETYASEGAARNLAAILRAVEPAASPARPKVVLVNVFYPPQAYGGATRVVHDVVRALSTRHRDRFDLDVFTSVDGGDAPYELRSFTHGGVRVTGVTSPAHDPDAVVDDPEMGRIFGRHLDALRPDLVHFHCIQRLSVAVVRAAQARGIPYVITVHDGWWISPHQFLLDRAGQLALYDYRDPPRTGKALGAEAFDRLLRLKPALFGARHVLAVSDGFARLHEARGVPRVKAIPNGLPDFPRPVRRPEPDGRVRLGYLGGPSDHKGWPLIRLALESRGFRNLALTVVDQALTPGETRIETWGGTPVAFVPGRPQSEAPELYGTIDVLLAPSVWPESFGLVSREALACGCWVVASDRGSIGEPVRHGVNGFVVDVSGPAGLAEALAAVDADPRRFKVPPPRLPGPERSSADLAEDLAGLYARLVGGQGPSAGPP